MLDHLNQLTSQSKSDTSYDIQTTDHTKQYYDKFSGQIDSVGSFDYLKELQPDSIEWRRLSDIYPAPTLFPDNFLLKESTYIDSTSFTTAIRLLADKYPAQVKALLVNQTVSPNGIYQLKLYINGELKTITIDDYIPINKRQNQPITSLAETEGALFVPLLEKTWAKVNGSYQRSSQTHTLQCLKILTGTPVEFLDHDSLDQDIVWKKLFSAIQYNDIVFSSSGDEKSLHESHNGKLFSILDATEVMTSDGKVKLVRFKCVASTMEWTGDWSQDCPQWTDQLKLHLGYKEAFEGNQCFMSFEDYITYFNSTCLSRARFSDHQPFSRDSLRQSHGAHSFALAHLVLPSHCDQIFLTIHQLSPLMIQPPYDSTYKPSKNRVIVGKVPNKSEIQYITANGGTEADLTIELTNLDKGLYVVYVENDWEMPDLVNSFVISTYSSHQLVLEAADKTAYAGVLERLLTSCALQKSKRVYYEKDPEKQKVFKCISLTDCNNIDLGYAYFCNSSNVADGPLLKDKLVFKELQGLKIANSDNQESIEVCLKPGEDKIYILKKTSTNISYKLTTYPRLVYKTLHSHSDMKSRGKKAQLIDETKGVSYNAHVFLLQHDNGFDFLFDNEEPEKKVLLKVSLTIENLVDQGEQPSEWAFSLDPGASETKRLEIVDVTQRTSLKYNFVFRVQEPPREYSESEILERCQREGEKKQIEYEGTTYQIYYSTLTLDDKQYWVFVNEERDKTLEGSLRLTLTNLEDQHGKQQVEWNVKLEPTSEPIVKVLHVNDIFAKCAVSLTSSFVVK